MYLFITNIQMLINAYFTDCSLVRLCLMIHNMKSPKADAILVAAGNGTRFGAAKQFAMLRDVPLYQHCLKTFAEHSDIDKIVIVVAADDVGRFEKEVWPLFYGKRIEITIGGTTRQDSVANGIDKLEELGGSNIVLIHDAARPFVSAEIISKVIEGVNDHNAALSAIPVVDTLKHSEEGHSISTIPRANVWRAQTPQGARFELLKKAFVSAHEGSYSATDEAELLERIGIKPFLVLGEETNIKITYRNDLEHLT